jgi:hypothetical protein
MVYGPLLYANHLRGFLGADPYVTVECDDKNKQINVIVTGCPFKADCLEAILITNEEFDKINDGRYNLLDYQIVVNGKRPSWKKIVNQSIIKAALAGNPYFKGIEKHSIRTPMGRTVSRWFGMLKPEFVQAPVDNFGSPFGIHTFTAEEFIKYAFCDKARDCVAWTTDRK